VHVTSENRDRKGTGENLRGAEIAICKIAGLRLPRFESWSCHNPAELRKRGCGPWRDALCTTVFSLHFPSCRCGADADHPSGVTRGEHELGRGRCGERIAAFTLEQLRRVRGDGGTDVEGERLLPPVLTAAPVHSLGTARSCSLVASPRARTVFWAGIPTVSLAFSFAR
jgi:hypothetical protein